MIPLESAHGAIDDSEGCQKARGIASLTPQRVGSRYTGLSYIGGVRVATTHISKHSYSYELVSGIFKTGVKES